MKKRHPLHAHNALVGLAGSAYASTMNIADTRYPIGRFQPAPFTNAEQRKTLLDQIADAPNCLRDAVAGLTPAQIETPYREGGWRVRQVVHHVPDSHMNAFLRTKFALTEDTPTIKPYDEAAWAKLADVDATPIAVSLDLVDSLHQRWMTLLTSLDENQFRRTFVHPEYGTVTIDWLVQLYAWHGRHHVAHITSLRERKGW